MLKKGDKIPKFELLDQNGKLRTSESLLNKDELVIFFYPRDFTPGCTAEVCSFRDNHAYFNDNSINVVGISADNPERHKGFIAKNNLPFDLLSDENNEVRNMFGLKGKFFGLIPDRVTFMVNNVGEITHVFDALILSKSHVQEVIKVLEEKVE